MNVLFLKLNAAATSIGRPPRRAGASRTRRATWAAVLFVLAFAWRSTPLSAAPPRLAVVVVVDQMRADYLDRFAREYLYGLGRLSREGAVFTQARHAHVPTETAPGHATLLTGCFPGQHGIVGNNWMDRATGKSVYAVEDPEHGVSPAHLLCPTLGDVLKSASPASRVVSVSGKDRAAILMGWHKADLVLWYDTSARQFVSSGYYGRLPDWVWNWDAVLRIPAQQSTPVIKLTLLDDMTLELARHAIEEENLGGRGVPDLLTISLSATDYLGHAVGPDSIEMHDHLVALDRELGLFIDYLDQRIGRREYVLALSSDHGVLPIPESETGRQMKAVRLLDSNFRQRMDDGLSLRLGPPPAGSSWVLDMLPPNLYLNMALARRRGIDPESLEREAAAVLEKMPEVARVYRPEEWLSGKVPSGRFADVFQRSFFPGRSGDLLILFKEGVLYAGSDLPTTHSTPYAYDSRIPLILLGHGIRSGKYDQDALSTDLVPTLAVVLGLNLPPKAPSRVLTEALQQDERTHPADSGRFMPPFGAGAIPAPR